MFLFAPADKPYKIYFEHRPGYLYVRVRSETTNYAIAKQYWVEILAMLHHRNYEHVMVDKDIDQPLQTPDLVMLVSELVQSGCSNVMFAILDRQYDAERCGFEELVGTSRGLQVRFCRTFDEAKCWLTGPSIAPALLTQAPFQAGSAHA
jgi:hypothetical protein